ncbi:MAG: hypothetical protein FJ388_09670 [Verrucomicrobia bacterium]|nr:hypothetical protein [Verrucomicrobiota bacterium]
MIYWLNRRVERAVEALLKTTCGDKMRVYRSADLTPRQFPCAVVHMMQNARVVGEMHAGNRMLGAIAVMTEFARVVDGDAQVIEEFEATEERAVSAVLDAVYTDTLAADLQAQGISGVTIYYAAVGDEAGVTSQSSEDGGVSVVTIPLVVRAGAVEE